MGLLLNKDVVGGKATIGQKILNGIGSDIPLLLKESRTALKKCERGDTGESYDDALALARACISAASQKQNGPSQLQQPMAILICSSKREVARLY